MRHTAASLMLGLLGASVEGFTLRLSSKLAPSTIAVAQLSTAVALQHQQQRQPQCNRKQRLHLRQQQRLQHSETRTTDDTVEQDNLKTYNQKDAPEEEKRGLGFSFTPGGLLFPYQLGICSSLMEKGFLSENTPIAGASAGALTSVVIGCGLDIKMIMEKTELLCKDCIEGGTR
jgi:hypothetical protein